jgi:hypothetical protein
VQLLKIGQEPNCEYEKLSKDINLKFRGVKRNFNNF